ncbi:MAG: ribonuclease HI [Patescibacteria group bacterium]|nr:ribonuclease HI [Patescibacteria group bacterium]
MSITIFTDGASRGNPGPGGWGVVIIMEHEAGNMKHKEIGGREEHTTNNRMELRAVIEGLRVIESGQKVIVNADSEYVVKGITLWIKGWITKGWKTASKKAVLNQDLWKELLEVSEGKDISWNVVKGHSGVKWNERADEIATAFADKVSL